MTSWRSPAWTGARVRDASDSSADYSAAGRSHRALPVSPDTVLRLTGGLASARHAGRAGRRRGDGDARQRHPSMPRSVCLRWSHFPRSRGRPSATWWRASLGGHRWVAAGLLTGPVASFWCRGNQVIPDIPGHSSPASSFIHDPWNRGRRITPHHGGTHDASWLHPRLAPHCYSPTRRLGRSGGPPSRPSHGPSCRAALTRGGAATWALLCRQSRRHLQQSSSGGTCRRWVVAARPGPRRLGLRPATLPSRRAPRPGQPKPCPFDPTALRELTAWVHVASGRPGSTATRQSVARVHSRSRRQRGPPTRRRASPASSRSGRVDSRTGRRRLSWSLLVNARALALPVLRCGVLLAAPGARVAMTPVGPGLGAAPARGSKR